MPLDSIPCEDVPPARRGLHCRLRDGFRKFATRTSEITGSAWCFACAVLLILLWAASYVFFRNMPDGFNTWQLIINSLTDIITFLMVFLIQNMQNRDAKAIHLKLDELIRALHSARNEMVSLEKLSDDDMKRLEQEFERIQQKAQARLAAAAAATASGNPSPAHASADAEPLGAA